MSTLTITAGGPQYSWITILHDILENGTFSPQGASGSTLTLTTGGLALRLNGNNLLAIGDRTISAGTITGFTLISSGNTVLTMTGLNSANAADLQSLVNGAGGVLANSTAFLTLIGPLFTDEALTATGSSGSDTIYGSAATDNINGGAGNDMLYGDAGNDTLFGGDGDDGLFGGTGNDKLNGGTGNNFYRGGEGADTFTGGTLTGSGRWDKVTYEYETGIQGITATFANGNITVVDTYADVDTGTSIEEIKGSIFDDVFFGSASNESAEGMAGNDTYDLKGGGDHVEFQHEYDAGTRKGVIVNLSKTTIVANVGDGSKSVFAGRALDSFRDTDKLISVEHITATRYSDYVAGSSSDNIILGLGGKDVLLGMAGKDRIIGGTGSDFMTGGTGADVFVFDKASETGKSTTTRDKISDFKHLSDDINLSSIDASSKNAGNNAFAWIGGQAFHKKAGELHFKFAGSNTTIVEGDINGDAKADFQIELIGRLTLSASDFIL